MRRKVSACINLHVAMVPESYQRVIVVVIREFYLQPAFHLLSEPFVKTSHVHFVPLYVGEAPFVKEELADAAELSVVVPEFGSALYLVLPLCIN
jgi:hypothetical protein